MDRLRNPLIDVEVDWTLLSGIAAGGVVAVFAAADFQAG